MPPDFNFFPSAGKSPSSMLFISVFKAQPEVIGIQSILDMNRDTSSVAAISYFQRVGDE